MTENLYTPDCIRTFSGKYANVFEPMAEMFCIEDIAHALSNQQRFGGHLPVKYSVAIHCVRGAHLLINMGKSNEEIFDFPMHDCSEAYLLDIPSPIKNRMPEYKIIEHNLMMFLSKQFQFNWPMTLLTSQIDLEMLKLEWNDHFLAAKGLNEQENDTRREFIKMYHKYKPKQAHF